MDGLPRVSPFKNGGTRYTYGKVSAEFRCIFYKTAMFSMSPKKCNYKCTLVQEMYVLGTGYWVSDRGVYMFQ